MANGHLPHWLRFVLFPIVIGLLGYWIASRGWLEDEIKRNESFEPPNDQQVKWDLRHIREDLHMLVLINFVLLSIIIYKELFR